MGPGKEGAAGGPGFVALACQAGFHSTSIHNTGPRGGREVGQTGLTIPRRVYLWLGLTQERGKMKKNGREKEKKYPQSEQCIYFPQKNKDFLKPPLCISAEQPRLAPTSCPSDNRLQGNSNANLEPDFSMGLYFCSSTRIGAFGSQPAGAVRMQSQSRTVGHFPFPSPFLTVTLLPVVLVSLAYMQMTSRARKKKGGHMELCE